MNTNRPAGAITLFTKNRMIQKYKRENGNRESGKRAARVIILRDAIKEFCKLYSSISVHDR